MLDGLDGGGFFFLRPSAGLGPLVGGPGLQWFFVF